MKIRNDEELVLFEKAIDRCNRTIWLITPCGKSYDLKRPSERYKAIAEMISASEYEEPEIYASCIEDEMTLFEFLAAQRAG